MNSCQPLNAPANAVMLDVPTTLASFSMLLSFALFARATLMEKALCLDMERLLARRPLEVVYVSEITKIAMNFLEAAMQNSEFSTAVLEYLTELGLLSRYSPGLPCVTKDNAAIASQTRVRFRATFPLLSSCVRNAQRGKPSRQSPYYSGYAGSAAVTRMVAEPPHALSAAILLVARVAHTTVPEAGGLPAHGPSRHWQWRVCYCRPFILVAPRPPDFAMRSARRHRVHEPAACPQLVEPTRNVEFRASP